MKSPAQGIALHQWPLRRGTTRARPIEVIYPATGETIARIHAATPNIVELAVEAARAAQAAWAALKACRARAHPAQGGRPACRAQ